MPVIKPIVKKVGIEPTGTKQITANGEYDVKEFANAKVNVPTPEGHIKPEGTLAITSNGKHDVTNYAEADVNVPIPDGYLKPSGTKEITSNGEHTVTEFDKVNVAVDVPDGYVVPSGNVNITSNGTHNVSGKATATVNVPVPDGYIVPNGELEVTENGDYDVTEKSSVSVNVPAEYTGGDWAYSEEANATGTTGVFEFVGAEDVTLTIATNYYHYNRLGTTYLSLTKPTSASDYDYSSDSASSWDTVVLGTASVMKGSTVYIWGTYYDSGDGFVSCGSTYNTATEVVVSDNTIIILAFTVDAGGGND